MRRVAVDTNALVSRLLLPDSSAGRADLLTLHPFEPIPILRPADWLASDHEPEG